ncbi:zinc finger MYM-type protein 1-like [Macrobrachium nipponense]|uniref:zinc finger MYM-type protein 1-like n=1 Tax=Macrobrachium nipponense TaxID=159736 RepID=UPI0030C85F6A
MGAEFVCLLQFFSEILGKINKVSQQLQDKQTDLGKAAKLISCLREDLADVRNSNLIENCSNTVDELCKKCDISPTATRKHSRKPRQLRDFIILETSGQRVVEPSHAQHVTILYEVLDCLNSKLERRFSKDSCVIFCGISALCPEGQTFLHEDDLKSFALSYSVKQSNLKHELPLVKKLLQKEPQPPTSLVEFLSFIHPYKSAFDCLYRLLLIAVTLPVTSASCKRSFSKIRIVKTFLRNSMTSERLSNTALSSIESKQAESIDLDSFVDEFDS